jgi:hypothetical protein
MRITKDITQFQSVAVNIVLWSIVIVGEIIVLNFL